MRTALFRLSAAMGFGFACIAGLTSAANGAENFYAGKNITMLIGTAAGGGYDTYERLALLRRAFDETLKDPEFLAEAKRLQMEIDPLKGEEVQALLQTAYRAPPALVARAAPLIP